MFIILFIIIIGGMLVIYITRLASNEIFSPSNKIHREVNRAKDLSAPLFIHTNRIVITGRSFGKKKKKKNLYVEVLQISERYK
jgi:hypothetical protein